MVSWKTHSDVWAHVTLRLFSGFSKIPSSVFFYWPAFMCTCSIYPPIIIIYCFSLPVILFQAAVSLQCFIFPLSITYSVLFFSPLCISNQVNLCSPKSQLCLKGLYKVYSIQHSLNNVWWRTHPFLSICKIFFWQLNNVNWLQMLFLGVQTKGKGRKIPKMKEGKKKLWFRDIKLIYNTHLYVNVNVDLDQIPGRQNRYNMEHIISSQP